jgi:methanogenic corrinoid protein MtbC1
MPMFKATINVLERAARRDWMAPATREHADAVGAGGYSADGSSAGKRAKGLIERDQGLVSV